MLPYYVSLAYGVTYDTVPRKVSNLVRKYTGIANFTAYIVYIMVVEIDN